MVQVGPRAATPAAPASPDAPPQPNGHEVTVPVEPREPARAGRREPPEVPVGPHDLPFLGLMVPGPVLRFWDLGAKAYHHDESLHAFYAWRLFDGQGYVHDP